MKCMLMHKNLPVVAVEMDDATGYVLNITDIYAPSHLPIGMQVRFGAVDKETFNQWWAVRTIPASRNGILEALEFLHISDTRVLPVRCYGLSLSDQYWIKPYDADMKWEDVNFFENSFSDDIGDVLFGIKKKTDKLNFASPDNTTDGYLKKRWKIINGKRCLIKGGSAPFQQQPFNEVIASEFMSKIEVAHVPYTLMWYKGTPYSVCEDFVNQNTELIPAWRIMMTQKKSNSTSLYRHFLNCSRTLGIPGVPDFLDQMITLDYIIANEDRHLNNFGALRNADTLEWIGMAPVYDSGSSLGYNKLPAQIRLAKDTECKPFKNHPIEQLKLVNSFDWLKCSELENAGEIIDKVFSEDTDENYIDKVRIEAITDSVKRRMEILERFIERERTESHRKHEDTARDDVKNNIAEDYSSGIEL